MVFWSVSTAANSSVRGTIGERSRHLCFSMDPVPPGYWLAPIQPVHAVPPCDVIGSPLCSNSLFALSRIRVMPVLIPDRSKLNPAFEAYRLHSPADADDTVVRRPLRSAVIPTGREHRAYQAPLGRAQVSARAKRNHLTVDQSGSRALFVDSARDVILVELDVSAVIPNKHWSWY
jgi:hypothetical protein